MATYFTDDFSDFATDWTEQYNTAGTWSVSGGDLTLPAAVANDWRGLSWNDIDGDANRANVELLIKLTTAGASGNTYFGFVRGSGADETATLYAIFINTSALRIYYCSGADAPTQAVTVAKTQAVSTTYWVRFRVNGSSPTTIQAKIWADGGGEPGTWDIDTTDSSGPTAAGWGGLSVYNAPGFSPTILQIGVGTNGDTAPSSAGGGSVTLTAAQGAYSLSGQAASIRTARQLVAGQGAYALTGQSSALRAARQIAAAQGSYALTGQDATLTYSGAGAKTLLADAGSYALTGQAAALRAARTLTAEQGAYAYTGQDAALRRLYTLTAGQGAYALTGQPAGILRGLRLPAAQGSYTLSGQAATLTYSGAAGSTISIVQPYITVYFWRRTA